jgi:uncharacterized protein
MKIYIDVNHPAHIHYFRNFIKIMKKKGHSIFVVSRDMEIMKMLLDYYKIDYYLRNRRPKNSIGKLFYVLQAIIITHKQVKKYKPDLYLGFASFLTAFMSFLFKKESVTFDDTEHNSTNHFLYKQFTKYLFTPNFFKKKILSSQEIFEGYMELTYLHPNYFRPNKTIKEDLGLDDGDRYIILRFISWDATHDRGNKGLDIAFKKELIRVLSRYAKVFISSEQQLIKELKPFELNIVPEKFHDVLFYADLVISEGATIASECACLGVPALYVNSLKVGNCNEQEKRYDLVFNFDSKDGVLSKAIEILSNPDVKKQWVKKKEKMLSEKIDVMKFMIDKIEVIIGDIEGDFIK